MPKYTRLEAGPVETLDDSDAILTAGWDGPVGHRVTTAHTPVTMGAVK